MLWSRFLLAFMLTTALAAPTDQKKKKTPGSLTIRPPTAEELKWVGALTSLVLGGSAFAFAIRSTRGPWGRGPSIGSQGNAPPRETGNESPRETGNEPPLGVNEVPYSVNNQLPFVEAQDPTEGRLNARGRERFRDCVRLMQGSELHSYIITRACFDYGRHEEWTIDDVYAAVAAEEDARRSTDSGPGDGNSPSQFAVNALEKLKATGRYFQAGKGKAQRKGAPFLTRPLVMRPGF